MGIPNIPLEAPNKIRYCQEQGRQILSSFSILFSPVIIGQSLRETSSKTRGG
jgi:hypothetical protein